MKKLIVGIGLCSVVVLCSINRAANYAAARYERRTANAATAGIGCEQALKGVEFMRRFGMFNRARKLERRGEELCLANFRQTYRLKPIPGPE